MKFILISKYFLLISIVLVDIHVQGMHVLNFYMSSMPDFYFLAWFVSIGVQPFCHKCGFGTVFGVCGSGGVIFAVSIPT